MAVSGCYCHVPQSTPTSACNSHQDSSRVRRSISHLPGGSVSSRQVGFMQSEFFGRSCPCPKGQAARNRFHSSSVKKSSGRVQILASAHRSSARDAALLNEDIMSGLTGGQISRRRSKGSRRDWRNIEVVQDESFQEELEALLWDHNPSARGANGRKVTKSQSRGFMEDLLREENFEFIAIKKKDSVDIRQDAEEDVDGNEENLGRKQGGDGGGGEAVTSVSPTDTMESDFYAVEKSRLNASILRDLEKELFRETAASTKSWSDLSLEDTNAGLVNRGRSKSVHDESVSQSGTYSNNANGNVSQKLLTPAGPDQQEVPKPISGNNSTVSGFAKLALHRSPILSKIEKSTFVTELEIVCEARSSPPDVRKVQSETRQLEIEGELKKIRGLIRQKGDFLREARVILQQLVVEHPLNANIWVHYAQLERQAGDLVAARSRYEQSIQIFHYWKNYGPQYMRALQAWATLEILEGKADSARLLFKKALKTSNKVKKNVDDDERDEGLTEAEVACLHSWAMLEKTNGSWVKARDLLQKAETLQPNNQIILQSRAMVEKLAHNWGLARKYFRLSTEASPSDAICWQAWGVMEGKLGNVNRMRELFKKSLSISPSNIYTLQAWAHNEAKINTEESQQKARELYQKCVDISPDASFAWQSWALMEQKAGNKDEARKLFESGLKHRPGDAACLQAFAIFEREGGNLRAARDILGLALALDSSNPAILQQAAEVEEELGHSEVAKELYIKAGLVDRTNNRRRKDMFEKRKILSHKASAINKKHGKTHRLKKEGINAREERERDEKKESINAREERKRDEKKDISNSQGSSNLAFNESRGNWRKFGVQNGVKNGTSA